VVVVDGDPVSAFLCGEVCAGVGGLSRGLERGGLHVAFHAEIATFPRRVLAHHWPTVPLLSDLNAISGGRRMKAHMRRHFSGLSLLAGGTPCQDLSVAGKRAGIFGLRSSLYFRFVRLWKVLDCPYILWENVAGALSSNKGGDFALVLSAIVGGSVPVPRDGWPRAGVVAGPTGVAAWRLLDAQWFGVPQRRLRVFVLGARAGGCDPAEVLLEPSGVRGNPPTRGEARQGVADGAGDGAAIPTVLAFGPNNSAAQGDSVSVSVSPALDISKVPAVLAYALGSHAGCADGEQTNESHESGGPVGMGISAELSHSLRAGRTQAVVVFDEANVTSPGNRSNPQPGDPHHTLHAPGHSIVVPLQEVGKRTGVSTTDVRAGVGIGADGDPMYTLQAGAQHGVVCATGDITRSLTHEGHDASEDGTGRGTPIVVFNETGHEKWKAENVAGSLNAHEAKEAHTIIAPMMANISGGVAKLDDVCGTLQAREKAGGLGGAQMHAVLAGIPRRLMPVECERLMDWPDGWTDVPDEKGKPASDSARYKACGNGVVSRCAEWIGARLVAAHNAMECAA
jgi:DNA (cytosine-5)-methyltransferase 1